MQFRWAIPLVFALALFCGAEPVMKVERSGPKLTIEVSSDLTNWHAFTNIDLGEEQQFFRALTSDSLPFNFINEIGNIRTVSWNESPYFSTAIESVQDGWGVLDAQGIRMYRAADGLAHEHPVLQGNYALSLINSYRATTNAEYLAKAELYGERLIETAIVSRGAWFYPYDFDFQIDPTPLPGDVIHKTWYSAMAEGTSISVFAQLYELTGKTVYLNAASNTFQAFKLPASQTEPWASDADETGCLWLEEYARDPQNHQFVLNGHVFAAWGLYEYWHMTGDPDALRLLQGAITTVKHWFPFFRTPGYVVKYSRKHANWAASYHPVIIQQMNSLYSLTGDLFFAHAVDDLLRDYPNPTIHAQGTLKGAINGVQFNEDGIITNSTAVLFPEPTIVDVLSRQTFPEQPGGWLKIGSGALSGFFVPELYTEAAMNCIFQETVFSPVRKITLRAGLPAFTFVKYFSDGTVDKTNTIYFGVNQPLEIDATATINSRLHARVASGEVAGYWIPITSRVVLD